VSFYGDKSNHHTTLFGVIVGIIYALTIVLTLEICVALYDRAHFSTFNSVALVAALVGFVVFSNLRRYAIHNVSWTIHGFGTIVRLWAGTFFVVVFSVYLTKSSTEFSRVVMTAWMLATPFSLMLVSLLCRLWALRLYSSKGERRSAVFVSFSDDAQRLAETCLKSKMLGIKALGFFDNRQEVQRFNSTLPRLGSLHEAIEWVQHNPVDVVFVGLVHTRSADIAPVVEALHDSVSSVYFVPESRLFGLGHIQYGEIAGTPVLVAYETPFLGVARWLKRLFDVVFSALILVLLSPVLAVIAIGVKLSSPGPVLFKQKRYGVGGQEIVVSKFRSMRNDPLPQNGEVKQATVGDARVTPFGRFLRKSSLDELPQFFNVLEGSMSIVGPRPHAVQHNELYRKQVKGYMLRHKVKPGITGWAQVNGLRGETDTLDKMQKRIEYDLYYIRNWSLELDVKIIFRTVAVVFRDRNAY